MRNLLLTISYDGKAFHGWQIQKNALAVQEVFQNALYNIIGGYADIKGCSRTDSGVHANMYCISLKTEHPIPAERLKAALNRHLPMEVAVYDCREVDKAFVGKHDFTSFCTLDKREKGDFVRNVKMFSVERDNDLVTMKVEADGFLYNMVRIMVGTLLRVQQGKIPEDGIKEIIEKKDRKFAGPTAPACGLYLNQVNY